MLPETRFLIQYLRSLKVGDIADFATMSKKAGVSIIRKRHILTAALNVLERDHKMFFENVPKIGYRAIASEEVPEKATLHLLSRTRASTAKARAKVHNSGHATTTIGQKALNQIAFVEFSADVEVQKAIAKSNKHIQAFDESERKNKLRKLMEDW